MKICYNFMEASQLFACFVQRLIPSLTRACRESKQLRSSSRTSWRGRLMVLLLQMEEKNVLIPQEIEICR